MVLSSEFCNLFFTFSNLGSDCINLYFEGLFDDCFWFGFSDDFGWAFGLEFAFNFISDVEGLFLGFNQIIKFSFQTGDVSLASVFSNDSLQFSDLFSSFNETSIEGTDTLTSFDGFRNDNGGIYGNFFIIALILAFFNNV